ncbi:histidine kinase [Lentzea atacamensis]|uniref:histidine kinase n=1 Tax=Lentzea atacamensis TaxID=531938 RepID=A0A316HDL0_9PSEU|nr:histidine kinase [Lentzea atacamensis]PWK78628.1 histidine kinase [Lentzea atacamensis]
MQALPLGLAVASVATVVSGAGLLLRQRAVVSATVMVLAGSGGVAAAVLLATGRDRLGEIVVAAAVAVLAPLALVTYPAAGWRHPADFAALVTVLGGGAITTVYRTADVAALIGLVQACVVLAHTWWRIEVATERRRRALVWMALSLAVTTLVCGFVVFAAEGSGTVLPAVAVAMFALVGPAMYIGATLPDLVDVRGLVVHAVVAVVGLITVMSVFVLALALLHAVGATQLNVGALALVAALSALALQPTRMVLRGVIDHLLFGERPDPLGAASQVAGTIGEDPVLALRAIREALVLPYAALVVGDEQVASSGTETTHSRTLDLDGAGRLVVGLRPGDLAFSEADEHVFRLTVPLLAQALRARALAADLIESRGQTITAVEEERRRLRRDLHDGLGPRLTGVAFTSDAASNLVHSDPAAAVELIAQLRSDTVQAIDEIRRMVYAMRPPALDELGLVPALRQRATGLRNRAGAPVAVEISAPDALPTLPAAVEVAAYRIVVEALTNIARHSDSPLATVRLVTGEGWLEVEIADRGRSDDWHPGVGLSSMRERAEELGGTLVAGPGPEGGRVTARLPLP